MDDHFSVWSHVISITIVTVSFGTLRAALANPVLTLKNE
jgi:hypothetical protein